ncbi:MAG: prefoldin subunit alpha [Candidatus Pacearchaeota archaeon]
MKEQKKLEQKILEFNALELQFNELEQYRAFVEKQIAELKILENSLEKLKEIKQDTEMFSPISQDVFLSSKLKENKKVLVNIGAKVFVKKTIEEAKESFRVKIEKLERLYEELTKKIEETASKLLQLEEEIKSF